MSRYVYYRVFPDVLMCACCILIKITYLLTYLLTYLEAVFCPIILFPAEPPLGSGQCPVYVTAMLTLASNLSRVAFNRNFVVDIARSVLCLLQLFSFVLGVNLPCLLSAAISLKLRMCVRLCVYVNQGCPKSSATHRHL